MKNKSIWMEKVKNNKLDKLNKDITCDVLIIGGGMAGLSAAYHMMNSDKKVVLIEKDICGMGATSKNTGKLTWMQDLTYSRLSNNYNSDIAKLYFDSQKDAIEMVKKIILENKIDCNLVKTKSYVFSNSENDYIDFSNEIDFYKHNNIKYKLLKKLPVKYMCKYAIETYDSYTFNPYKYLVSLKNIVKDRIRIYENTRCETINKDGVFYNVIVKGNYKIKCKYVVVASHYPTFVIPFLIPFKTKVDKFFLGASKCSESSDVQLISYSKHSVSMRYYKDNGNNYFIYGRRNHSTTNNLDIRVDYKELSDEYKKYFGKDIEYFFHTHDLMTYDGLPFIGLVSQNLFICTGFNKWGNTNGSIAGKIISDLINGVDNRYVSLFNPRRGISVDKVKNLILYNVIVGSRYILNKIISNKKFYDDRVRIEYINDNKCGVYIDDDKKKHIVSNICPHMKCNLVFNYIDKTWDCPCHASRFDIDGKVIYGPSVYDIKIKL